MFRHPVTAIALATAALAAPAVVRADEAGWTGLYVGAEAGAASGKQTVTGAQNCGGATSGDCAAQLSNVVVPGRGLVVVPGTVIAFSGSGSDWNPVYGGLVGGQWQSGRLIFGLEGDLDGARDLASSSTPVAMPATVLAPASSATLSRSAHSTYDWSVRARLGAPIRSNAMIYASGGVAGARVRLTGEDSFTTPAGAAATGGGIPAFNSPAIGPVLIVASQTKTMTGWTVGAGMEIKLSSKIGLGFDGRYTDYGSKTFELAGACTVATVAAGACAGASRTSPPIVINGTTLNPATDITPGVVPGATRVSLHDVRLTARVVFHF